MQTDAIGIHRICIRILCKMRLNVIIQGCLAKIVRKRNEHINKSANNRMIIIRNPRTRNIEFLPRIILNDDKSIKFTTYKENNYKIIKITKQYIFIILLTALSVPKLSYQYEIEQ